MKAKLIKTFYDGWTHYHAKDEKNNTIATTNFPFSAEAELIAQGKNLKLQKLSLKNCQAIENGYDLDELAKQKYPYEKTGIYEIFESDCKREGFIEGAKAILEILGDKKFSINEVVELSKILISNPIERCGKTLQELVDAYVKSLQQTEWEVEIAMRPASLVYKTVEMLPVLDADGCLILKRI